MKISPHTHVESHLTGSTVANMVSRAKEMGRTHFAYTDHGHLSSCLKTYALCQPDKKAKKEHLKRKLQFIPGIEIYFKDSNCPIIGGTPVNRCKYFTATIYCEDQNAYQELCRIVSRTDFPTIDIYEENHQLWSWNHLEEIAKFNTNIVLGGVHCMAGKPMLAGRADLGEMVLNHIKGIFKDRAYVSLVCEPLSKKYSQIIKINYTDETYSTCLSSDYMTTDKARRIKASDMLERQYHTVVKAIYSNSTYQEINKTIASMKLHKGFLPLPGGDAMTKVNKFLKALSKKHGIPVLASDYAYYANKEDKIVQTMRLEGNNKLQPNFYMKTQEEIESYLECNLLLSKAEIALILSSNNEWAKRFDNLTLKYDWHLAKSDEDPIRKAMQIIKENGRMRWDDPVWVDRLKEELNVIAKNPKKDLTAYFLPIRDVLYEYKNKGFLTGPGRGSAGGSLFCYLLGITQVNPFKFDLPFNRFFSMERINMGKLPDIDVDLEGRELLVGEDGKSGYLYGRWGNKAAQISTRTTIRLKSAIKDTNRYFKGKVEPEVEVFTKGLPAPPQGINDHDFVFGFESEDGEHMDGLIETSEDLKKYSENRPEEWDIISKAMGLTRAYSKHASAFVLSDIPIQDMVPTKEGYITQYEAKECEAAGLIKYDFLVINQLKDIRVCMELVNKKYGIKLTVGQFMHEGRELYIWDLPEIAEVFKSVWGGMTEAIFQISTRSMIPAVMEILPTSIMQIANILALIRPGPVDCIDPITGRNMVEEYYLRRKGQADPDIKELMDILPETYGIMCIKKGSKIKTSKEIKNIELISKGDLVQTEDGSYKTVLNNYYKGAKKTIKVRLDNSEELFLTPDHKVLTAEGWKEAGKLTKKDLIKHFWISDKKIQEGDDKDWVIGLLLADGQIPVNATPAICAGSNKKTAIKIKKIADKAWQLNSKIYYHTRAWYVRLTANSNGSGIKGINPLINFIKKEKLTGTTCHTKFFPKSVTKKMIEGFIEGDGCLSNRTIRIVNENMARTIFETLQAMRIKSSLFNRDGVWFITFSPEKFDYKIKKYNGKKEKGLFYPKPALKLPRSDNKRQYFYNKKLKEFPFISEYLLKKICEEYKVKYDFKQTWSKILSVFDSNVEEVYDLSIDTNHSFVVGGNVVHNCFQEQLGKVSKALAGFSGEEAEKLRENMAKKKKVELVAMKPQFIGGATPKVGKEVAEKIWDQMETFGRYGFSIIHAVEYAMITYACMFLKHYYPLEWWAAILTNATEQEITGKFWPYVKDMVASPDINLSSDVMVVDYANDKIRAKLGVIRGIGEATIEPIVSGRPYKDIQDFVNKEVAGSSLSHKLILVGVLDSLFPPKLSLLEKLKMFEDAQENKKFASKLEKASLTGRKIKATQPKEGKIPEEYLNLHPLQDAALKKSVLPSMPINLYDLGKKYSKVLAPFETVPSVMSSRGYSTRLIDGERLRRLDEMPGESVEKDIYVAATCYVIKAEEFAYQKGAKRALKLTLDADGFVSEKILWPDYDSGQLIYPVELKKGAIIVVFLRKKSGKKDMSIQGVSVET